MLHKTSCGLINNKIQAKDCTYSTLRGGGHVLQCINYCVIEVGSQLWDGGDVFIINSTLNVQALQLQLSRSGQVYINFILCIEHIWHRRICLFIQNSFFFWCFLHSFLISDVV
jgi:hypothetical protein